MSTEDQFQGIVNATISEEAQASLNAQMAKVRSWIRERQDAGETTELRDLLKFLNRERDNRSVVITAYTAAMWRLLQLEDPRYE